MKTKQVFIIFIAVVILQLFIPAQMILNQESILKTGVAYKFKTQPVDPSDPFKGKYIILNYDINEFGTSNLSWQRNEPIYVYLVADSLGYAKVETVSRNVLLESENDYVSANVSYYDKGENKLVFDFPFDKYYMEETKAYDAEMVVRNRQLDSIPNNTYALVYIEEGEAVLSDVIINNTSIKDYVVNND